MCMSVCCDVGDWDDERQFPISFYETRSNEAISAKEKEQMY